MALSSDVLKTNVFISPKFKSVVNDAILFFSNTPVYDLPIKDSFPGSGVYALYYRGKFNLYESISVQNKEKCVQPIYVGKAVPPGWRTGRNIKTKTTELYARLNQHVRSLEHVGLNVKDFQCQFIILSGIESDLVVPIEAELIRRFTPLWNTVVDGFGNHDPGSGRYNQAASGWDVLHPGRPWTEKLTGESITRNKVAEAIAEYVVKSKKSS